MKLSNFKFSGLILTSLIVFACNGSNHQDTDNSLPKFDIVESEQPAMQDPNATVQPVNISQPVSAGMALNPPHGQPGHDCAIPVGQPLSSPAPNLSTTPTPVSSPAVSTLPGPRLNPAHGEPGHVCEIPVGQPLP